MLESIIVFLSSVPWYWVLITAMLVAFIENIFPPAPSDSIIIFTGTLVAIGDIGLIPLLIASTIGSIAGFAIMFYLGLYIGGRVIKSKRIPFINPENIKRPNKWLDKYGFYIIALNRFLSGTRGVISFLAGMAKMSPAKTISLAAASALVWNFILIYLGVILGKRWRIAENYLEKYGEWIFYFVLSAVVLIALKFLYNYLKRRKRYNN